MSEPSRKSTEENSSEEPVVLPTGPRVDPYEMYRAMREEKVVHLIREPNGLRRRLVLRYAEAREVFTDARFAKDPGLAWDQLRDAGYVKGDRDNRADYLYHLVNTDPPDHTRLRRLIGKAFSVRRMEAIRPRVEEIAEDLLARMKPDAVTDLVDDYAHPLATTVICEILGVPDADRTDFRLWATAMLTAPDAVPEGDLTPQEGYAAMRGFFTELIARKRAELAGRAASGDADRQPDVLSGLIVARDRDDRLTETEMISTAMLLLSAGQEPTVNLICNGTLSLLRNPGQLALLRDKPELIGSAVEEFLRFDPPVELSTMRVSTEDVEVAGTVIPAGSVVTVSIASTSRDPGKFTDPDRLDITREDNQHLAFGHGLHLCIGAPLARIEGQIGIGRLLARYPGLTLGCAPEDLRWRPTRIMRGLVELPVRLTPGA
ncbi:cytochrome P450 family protein [Streptomyces specialis]|uniref:cytochrome P450 family protein n=1 Tax=Streptomyces specialis TaxID=498367 RepID=UPI000A59861C|nr:cytochrome P450 [Streptomyces specialis]